MTESSIEPFARAHLDGLIALIAAEGWTEYTEDAERTYRALSARGVTTLVALADQRVVGAIQVQSDGVIQSHVSMLLIDREWRGRRLCSRLLREGLERAGGLWLDIRTGPRGTTNALARATRSDFASRARRSGSGGRRLARSGAPASRPELPEGSTGQELLDHRSGQRAVEELADPVLVVGPFEVGRGQQPASAALVEDVRELRDRHREVRRVLNAPGSACLRVRGADDTRPPRIRAVLDEDQGELL
jgi:hypothetical protein